MIQRLIFFSIPINKKYFDSPKSFDLIAEPENKLTSMTSVEVIKYHEKQFLADGAMSMKFLAEKLRVVFLTFSIPHFSPFFEEFKSKIQTLIEVGICPEKLAMKTTPQVFHHTREERKVPAMVLNMDDLSIGFLICLVPMALSVIIFICEISSTRMKTLAVHTRDLLIFLYLIKAVPRIGFY